MSAKRLTGKPLLKINNLPIISHVFKRGVPGKRLADNLEGIKIRTLFIYDVFSLCVQQTQIRILKLK